MKKIRKYIKESFTELLHKVTWPTWSELQNSTTVVMIASLIIAVAIWIMDYAFDNIMSFVYELLY
ncbi:MAG: preprotein translocase subunit SecE [Bacteroidales bacterium]|nr:preprotein translocase subunit SecE [Bacteroidales bacterium]HKL67850.1 preprotein translocase subunit SecE [Bacteroidales bacterium]